jgi:hypothetical protein
MEKTEMKKDNAENEDKIRKRKWKRYRHQRKDEIRNIKKWEQNKGQSEAEVIDM